MTAVQDTLVERARVARTGSLALFVQPAGIRCNGKHTAAANMHTPAATNTRQRRTRGSGAHTSSHEHVTVAHPRHRRTHRQRPTRRRRKHAAAANTRQRRTRRSREAGSVALHSDRTTNN